MKNVKFYMPWQFSAYKYHRSYSWYTGTNYSRDGLPAIAGLVYQF